MPRPHFMLAIVILSTGALSAAPLPEIDKLWDYDHPAETEQSFRKLVDPAATAKDAAYLAELQTQIARTQGLQRKFDEAHRTLDEVEKSLPPGASRARVRLELERGRVFNSSGKVDLARPHFLAAWEMATKLSEEVLAIDAAHMMGIVEKGASAMEWNQKALKLAESSKDEKGRHWQGSLYNNIGWAYHDDIKGYARALEMFEKALVVRQREGNPGEVLIARWAVARAHRSLGHVDEALAMQQSLAEEHRQAHTADPYVHEELGELFLLKKRDAEAKAEFAQAYPELIKDAGLLQSERPRLERIRTLAGVTTPLPH